jgi:putative ABC transport system permease protein
VKTILQDWLRPLRLSLRFRAVSMAALLLASGCALLHKRPPYHDPDRLVSVVKVAPAGEAPIRGADFLALRSESKTLEPIAAYVYKPFILTEREPERIDSVQVTADFFPTLGVNPVLGRALLPDDNKPDSNPVVVISHTLWLRRFGADPNLIGRTLTLDRERRTVVGIMPPDFQFPKDCHAWTPLASDFHDVNLALESKNTSIGVEVEVFARLKPGVTLQQAQADISLITSKLEGDHPESDSGRDIKLTALRESSIQKENLKGKVLEIKVRPSAKPPAETGKEK